MKANHNLGFNFSDAALEALSNITGEKDCTIAHTVINWLYILNGKLINYCNKKTPNISGL
jgi:hypothetical protein